MIDVLVVVPYEELKKDFDEVIGSIKKEDIRFTTTYIYGTDRNALKEADGYDIVVVRGVTCQAIKKEYPDIHTVEISMTGYDILDALAEAKNLYGEVKVGIVHQDSHICHLPTFNALSRIALSFAKINDETEVPRMVDALAKTGCQVIVGGLTACNYAEMKGIKSVPIRTSHDTIVRTMDDVLEAADIIDKERTRASVFSNMVDTLPSALIAIGPDGNVLAANGNATALFHKDLVGLPFSYAHSSAMIKTAMLTGAECEFVDQIAGERMLIIISPFSLNSNAGGVLLNIQNVEKFYQTEQKVRSKLHEKGHTAKYHFSDIVAKQLSMRQLIAKALRYAKVDGNVLLTGETGTGKELFVQSMHNASSRASGPFIAVNCAAISEQLLESELFGYVEGAFTGAKKQGKIGLFEMAHGGTIFLDEIGELPLKLQAKLLRVLQEGEVMKVGSDEVVSVDVRVMSATNKNIPELIAQGLFRRDLYYRINLLSLVIPPLRERGNDLGILFEHFVKLNAEKMHMKVPLVTSDAINELMKYSWKGNIRELRNVAERIVVLNGSQTINVDTIINADIPESEKISNNTEPGFRAGVSGVSRAGLRHLSDEELWNLYLNSNMSLVDFAAHTGISRTTLWRRFKNMESE